MTKMLIDRSTVEQALEALEMESNPTAVVEVAEGRWELKSDLAITALRAALVEDSMQKFTDVNQELDAALAETQEPAPMPPFPPVSQWKRGCAVCGIGADGKAYGYACPRLDCPTRVTCGRG